MSWLDLAQKYIAEEYLEKEICRQLREVYAQRTPGEENLASLQTPIPPACVVCSPRPSAPAQKIVDSIVTFPEGEVGPHPRGPSAQDGGKYGYNLPVGKVGWHLPTTLPLGEDSGVVEANEVDEYGGFLEGEEEPAGILELTFPKEEYLP